MDLNVTTALLDRLRSEGKLERYAVAVGIGGEESVVLAPGTDEETYFDVASMGKVLVTSTLILKAVGEGRIRLGDTLPRFFRNVPPEKAGITVEHLLTHTSGILRTLIPEDVAAGGREAVKDFILAPPLAFAPGTKTVYSCHGFILLGFILETVFGKPLDAVFETELKPALGLTRSRFNLPVDEPNAADCFERREMGDLRADDINVIRLHGVAGSGASFWTLSDVRRFVSAVRDRSEKLFPAEIHAMAETDHTPGLTAGRGLGYEFVDERFPMTGDLFPAGSFGHHGHTGVSFFFHRPSGLYAILLTNATRCAKRLADFGPLRYDMSLLDYGEVFAVRRAIHDAVAEDLRRQNRLPVSR